MKIAIWMPQNCDIDISFYKHNITLPKTSFMIHIKRTLLVFFMFGCSIFPPFGATIMRLYWKKIAKKRDGERMFAYHLDREFSPQFGYNKNTILETGHMKRTRIKAEQAQFKYELYTEMVYCMWIWKKWQLCYEYVIGKEFMNLRIVKTQFHYRWH